GAGRMKILRQSPVLIVLIFGLLVVGMVPFLVDRSTEQSGRRQKRMEVDLEGDRSAAPIGNVGFLDISGKQMLPRYVDLAVGDGLRIRKCSGESRQAGYL
ncbi:MAG: hypothetical protein MUO62_16160, partial [Anaerolineales bacterium]|nr:hypothetical protein [Anaerolineales bacterium]